MLDKPDFVGTYEIGDFVYFFFRETAVEYMNCGKTIYSRIARVCKKDTGGKNILLQNWATYLKARLNCSISGEFPFFFNEIQDVFKPSYDDSVFHAVFSTNQNGLHGSAICSFDLRDVEQVFEGKFKEQASSTSMWLPVPSAQVPNPRPGSCVSDTRSLPDTVLNFIRKHPLMHTDVPHDDSKPAFVIKDVTLTKLVVDNQVTGQGQDYTIYYAGTNQGKIYKVSRWRNHNGKHESALLDVFEAFPEAIRAMVISRELRMLFVSSDSFIKAIGINEQCTTSYTNCLECVKDPHCGWNRQTGVCSAYAKHLLQDAKGEMPSICEASLNRQKITANFGSALHLSCPLKGGSKVEWYHYDNGQHRRHVQSLDGKYVLTQDQGLVIIGLKEMDAGQYDCKMEHQTITSYKVSVDFQRCSSPQKSGEYQKAYTEWCNEFHKYRSALQAWEDKQTNCLTSDNSFKSFESQTSNNPFL